MKQGNRLICLTHPYRQTTQTTHYFMQTTMQGTPHRAEPWGTKAHHTGPNQGTLKTGTILPTLPPTNHHWTGGLHMKSSATKREMDCPCHAATPWHRDYHTDWISWTTIYVTLPCVISLHRVSLCRHWLPHIQLLQITGTRSFTTPLRGRPGRTDNETTKTLRCAHGTRHYTTDGRLRLRRSGAVRRQQGREGDRRGLRTQTDKTPTGFIWKTARKPTRRVLVLSSLSDISRFLTRPANQKVRWCPPTHGTWVRCVDPLAST